MARYISATATHPDGRIPGEELTLIIDEYEGVEDAILGGGKEAADALLANVPLPAPREVVNLLLGRRAAWKKGDAISAKSKQQSGDLARAISGEPRGKSYNAVSRTLQRWADGTRKPTLKTAEKYQQAFFAHTGRRSAGLARLIRAIEGRASPEDLKPGLLHIIIKGTMIPYPGSDDERNRPVKIVVREEWRILRQRAFDDPIEVWLEIFHLETDVVLLSCDWLFMEYLEKEA